MATVESLRSGYWDVGSTWSGSQVPNLGADDAVIRDRHVVTVRTSVNLSVYPRKITVQAGGALEVAGSYLTVNNGCELWVVGGSLVLRGGVTRVLEGTLYLMTGASLVVAGGKCWLGDTAFVGLDGSSQVRFQRREWTVTNSDQQRAIFDFQRAYGLNGGPQLMGKF